MECSICMNGFEDHIFSTYCGHLFCKKCSDQMILSTSSCWTCSSPLTSTKVHRIYLPQTRNNSFDTDDDNVTKLEILKTLMTDYQDIKREDYDKPMNMIHQSMDEFTMNLVKYTSLVDTLTKRIENIEEIMAKIEQRLNKHESPQ